MKQTKYVVLTLLLSTLLGGANASEESVEYKLPSGTEKCCCLETITAEQTNAIRIGLTVFRGKEYNKETWNDICDKSLSYVRTCQEGKVTGRDLFTQLGALVTELHCKLREDEANNGIHGTVEVLLSDNGFKDYETKSLKDFDKAIFGDVEKLTIYIDVKRDQIEDNKKDWEELFDIVRDYAVMCNKSFEYEDDLVIKITEVILSVYDIAHANDTLHGSLDFGFDGNNIKSQEKK